MDNTKFVKVYYDAEFTELSRNGSLISIGLISESGAYFYAEFDDYDKTEISPWLQTNVISHLLFADDDHGLNVTQFTDPGGDPHSNVEMRGNHSEITSELLKWVANESGHSEYTIQIFCDCYTYDWMLLVDLLSFSGNAMDMPNCISYIPIDLSTVMYVNGVDPDITREEFIEDADLEALKSQRPFSSFSDELKHNSLWDAAVCQLCFNKLTKGSSDN